METLDINTNFTLTWVDRFSAFHLQNDSRAPVNQARKWTFLTIRFDPYFFSITVRTGCFCVLSPCSLMCCPRWKSLYFADHRLGMVFQFSLTLFDPWKSSTIGHWLVSSWQLWMLNEKDISLLWTPWWWNTVKAFSSTSLDLITINQWSHGQVCEHRVFTLILSRLFAIIQPPGYLKQGQIWEIILIGIVGK